MNNRRAIMAVLLILFVVGIAPAKKVVAPAPVEIDRRVYIPSSQLNLLTNNGKPGILLSAKEYQKLLKEAGVETGKPAIKLPFLAALQSAKYRAELETDKQDCLRVKATYRVTVLSATWGEVGFQFKDAAPASVSVDGKPLIVNMTKKGARLLLYGRGTHEVAVEFDARVHREPSRSWVQFFTPSAPSAVMHLTLPGKQAVSSSLPLALSYEKDSTRVIVSVGKSSKIDLSWRAETDIIQGEKSALFAQSHLAYEVNESLVQISGTLLLTTMMDDLPQRCSFVLPAGASVRQLEGSAVHGWSVDGSTVIVDRTAGKLDRLELNIKIEIPRQMHGKAALPVITVPSAFRHYGELALIGTRRVKLRVDETSNLEAIEPKLFFGSDLGAVQPFLASYRFFSEPVSLAFRAEAVEADMEASVGSWVHFRQDGVYRQRHLEIVQRKGESGRVVLLLPPSEEFVKILDSKGQEVDIDPQERDSGTQLRIDLPDIITAGAIATFTVHTRIYPKGYGELDEDGLSLSLQSIKVQGCERLNGTLAVGADKRLRLKDLDRGDLESAPRPPQHPDALQSFYFRDSYNLSIRVSRRASELDAVVLLDLLPHQDYLTVRGEVRYNVLYAGRKTFSIAFPKGLGSLFYPEGGGVVEREMKAEEKWDRWTLTLKDPVQGSYLIHFNGDMPMNGKATVPEVWVPDARRERGFMIVEANTETEIEFESKGLATVDITKAPKLHTYTPKHRTIGAYRYFVHPYTLVLKVKRHQTQAVLAAMADELSLMTIVSPGGAVRNRATYSVRGVRTPFLRIALPKGSSLWGSNVAGQPVKPMHGPDGSIRIPLGGSFDSANAIEVELVYETKSDRFARSGKAEFLAPRLLDGLPVGKTNWKLYLPREYHYSKIDSDLQLAQEPAPVPLAVVAAAEIGERLIINGDGILIPNFLSADNAAEYRTYYLRKGAPVTSNVPNWDDVPDMRLLLGDVELIDVDVSNYAWSSKTAVFRFKSADELSVVGTSGADSKGKSKVLSPEFNEQAKVLFERYKKSGEKIEELSSFMYGGYEVNASGNPVMPKADEIAKMEERLYKKVNEHKANKKALEKLGRSTGLSTDYYVDGLQETAQVQLASPRVPALKNLPVLGAQFRPSNRAPASAPPAKLPRIETQVGLPSVGAVVAGIELEDSTDKVKYSKFIFGDPAIVGENAYAPQGGIAGILPFDIKLQPQGVEYVFSGLRQGERVALSFRRADSWCARNVFLVIIAALAFAAWIHNRKPVKYTIWTIFALTALSYLLGSAWVGFFNHALIGVGLGLLFSFALRLRLRWWGMGMKRAALMLMLGLSLGGSAWSDTVYIPYDPAHPEMATAEERVFVPYERFEKLWAQARAKNATTTDPAPVDFALSDAEYTLNVNGNNVRIEAAFKLLLPQKGWQTVPLPFSGVKLIEAQVDGAPARIEKAETGYNLYLSESGMHRLTIIMMAQAKRASSVSKLEMGIPRTFAAKALVILPDKELEVEIEPSFQGQIERISDSRKEVVAALGQTERLNIQWSLPASRLRPTAPTSAEVLIHHSVVGALENWSAEVDLSFGETIRSGFEFELGKGLIPTSIEVPNLASWKIVEENGKRTLQIELSQGVKQQVKIKILAERQTEASQRVAPGLIVTGARQTNTKLVLCAAPWIDLRVEREGFSRVERPKEKTAGLRCIGAYQTSRNDASLTYLVEQRPQEIDWNLDYLFQVESRKIEEIVLVDMEVRRRPLFGLVIEIPAGYRCDNIDGKAIRSWWQEDSQTAGEKSRVDVEFNGAVSGKERMIVHLIRRFEGEPDTLQMEPIRLITPSGTVRGRTDGSVVVAAHVSVRPVPRQENGLRSQKLESSKGRFTVTLPLEKKLSYRMLQPDFSASLSLQRIDPRFNVSWITLAQVNETWIAYSSKIDFALQEGSHKIWEFTAPTALGEINVTGKRVREVSFSDSGVTRLYQVQLDSEVFDGDTLELNYETPIQKAANVPHLGFPGAARASGHLITANLSPYELIEEASGTLGTVLKSQLPAVPDNIGILGCYKTHGDDWDLGLRLERTVAAKTLEAVVDWIDLETQARRDGSFLHRASIRMQNKTLQFLPLRLPKGATLLSLFVAGDASKANRGTRNGVDIILAPLIKTAPGDLAFEVQLTYETPAEKSLDKLVGLAFAGPEVLDLPVGQTFWTFYLPPEYNLHGIKGNMEETASVLRQASILNAKEEERQRLKQIITGDNDLLEQSRALRNYRVLEGEISRLNSTLNDVQMDEVLYNTRLNRKAGALRSELMTENRGIAESLDRDKDGKLQKRMEDIQQRISGKQQEQDFGVPQSGMEGADRINWKREAGEQTISTTSLSWSALVPRLEERGIRQSEGYLQVGGNVFVAGEQESAKVEKKKAVMDDTASEYIGFYSNVNQSLSQKKYSRKQIELSNEELVKTLELGARKDSPQRVQGRNFGRFDQIGKQTYDPSGGVVSQGDIIASQASLGVRGVRVQQLSALPGQEAAIKEEIARRTSGAYSISIPFPKQGRVYTFKKPKAGASVRFTMVHEQLPAKAWQIAYWIVAALLLQLLIWLFSHEGVINYLRKRHVALLFLGSVFFLLFNITISIALLVAACVALIVRRRIRKNSIAAA
jgi:hypothetical protein